MEQAGMNTPPLVDEEDDEQDDDSSVASSPFDAGGFLDNLNYVDGAAGDGQQLSSAAAPAAAEGHPFSPGAAAAATAATEATTAPDEPTNLSVAGPSMSSEVQHGYQLRKRIPRPPNAFMLFAQEQRRSVAAENPNENNQCVSTRLGKLWRSLSAADKERYQRMAAEAAAIHRTKYPGYVYNPREAHRRKEQARIDKAIVAKVKKEPSEDQELEAQSTSASQGPSTPQCQHVPRPPQSPPPLPHRLRRWATSGTLARTQADGLATPTGRSTAAAPATATARPVAQPYCRLRRALLRPLRRVGTVPAYQQPTTYPRNQLSTLVACTRNCAAVPHPQVNGPRLPQFFDESAQPLAWFFDQIPPATAAHMTVGVAAAPMLCWPVFAAAGSPALAPSLPFLLPTAVAPTVVTPHFALPGPQVQLPSPEAAARSGLMQFFYVMQPEQQRNRANATRSAPTGTVMPIPASRQQRIAGSRRSSAQAAASGPAGATLWPPVTAQATQHQDTRGPFQPGAFVASRVMTDTSIPCPNSTQVRCTGAGAQPCNASRGPYSDLGGIPILQGTSTSLQEPATSGSNQPPRGRPAVDRYQPRLMVQQQQEQPIQQQQQTVGQPPPRSSLNLSGRQQPSWGGPFGPDVDLVMEMIGGSAAQPQPPNSSTPTFSAAPESTQQFPRAS